jgi:hypothetical protein
MKGASWLLALAWSVAPLAAQSSLLICRTSGVPGAIRMEGLTEPAGAILLSCSGGLPTAAARASGFTIARSPRRFTGGRLRVWPEFNKSTPSFLRICPP